MPRSSLLAVLVFTLCASVSGCLAWPEPIAPTASNPHEAASWPDRSHGPYSFAWRLSGAQAIGPLQVFDNGEQTWLHFAPDQILPAIFGVRDGTEELLPYQRRGPYVQLSGVWPRLVLRGGALSASAERLETHAAPPAAPEGKRAAQ